MGIIARYTIVFILLFSIFLVHLQPVKSDDTKIVVQYFYNESCSACNETKPIINNTEQYFGDKITVQRYQVEDNPETENYKKWRNYYGFEYLPSVVVLNISSGSYAKFPYGQITEEKLKFTIERYLAGENPGALNFFLIIGVIAVIFIVTVIVFIISRKIIKR